MKNKITQKYSLNIYPRSYIEKGILDYKNVCKIDLNCNENAIECTFYDSVADLDLTAKEFSNYLIELINSRGMTC